MNPYETLNVPRNAHPDDIKAAYRRCCSTAHPDRVGGSGERMQAVNEAYAVLSDPVRRERYDLTGDAEAPPIDRMAVEVLRQAFATAIDQDQDPVRYTEQYLTNARGGAVAQLAEVDGRIKVLKRREGKTKVKAGRNLVDEVIASKLSAAQRQQAQCKTALEAVDAACVLFGEYIREPEPAIVTDGLSPLPTFMQGQDARRFNEYMQAKADAAHQQNFADFFRGMK